MLLTRRIPLAVRQHTHSLLLARSLQMASRTSPRKRRAVNYSETGTGNDDDGLEAKPAAPKAASSNKRKAAPKEEPQLQSSGSETTVAKKKRTSKADTEGKPAAAEPVGRTCVADLGKAMYIGAHVSASGGVHNAVDNAVQIGANSFALFLKSQRKWQSPAMTPEARTGFIDGCKHHNFRPGEHALPHGSYLVNLAQADADKAQQAYDSFVDDLKRCEQLGIVLYNFHPGSTGGGDRGEAIARIAAQLNKSHRATKTVVTVLENMAGAGNVIGATWGDLRDIIALVEDKQRVGVCIDTCHTFAAGYDLRTPEAFRKTMASFNEIVGVKYLKALHLNDSKAPLDSQRDLHANIGTGFLGLRAFHSVMNHEDFQGLPMILETPIDKEGPDGKKVEDKNVWAEEIKLLESLIGMDPETDAFRELEKKLQAKGASERKKIQEQVDRKAEKDAKKGTTSKPKRTLMDAGFKKGLKPLE